MRSTALITTIRGCDRGTAFLEESTGALWFVTNHGNVTRLAESGVQDVEVSPSCGLVLFKTGELGVFSTYNSDDYLKPLRNVNFGLNGQRPPYGTIVKTGLQHIVSIACAESGSFAVTRGGELYMTGGDAEFYQSRLSGESGSSQVSVNGGNFTLHLAPTKDTYVLIRTGVAHVTTAIRDSKKMVMDLALVTDLDGTLNYLSGIVTDMGVAPWYRAHDPVSLSKVIRMVNDRQVLVEKDGTTWHRGLFQSHGMSAPPKGYHFEHTRVWRVVPDLSLTDIHLDTKGGAIALSKEGTVLFCCGGMARKFGAWSHTPYQLYENRQQAEQIALTAGASFIRQDGEWFSSYNDNPHSALSLRDDLEKYCYMRMTHPEDWQHVSSMKSIGLEDYDAIRATLALS